VAIQQPWKPSDFHRRKSWSALEVQPVPSKSGTWKLPAWSGRSLAIDPASDRIMITFATSPQDATLRLFTGWARTP